MSPFFGLEDHNGQWSPVWHKGRVRFTQLIKGILHDRVKCDLLLPVYLSEPSADMRNFTHFGLY